MNLAGPDGAANGGAPDGSRDPSAHRFCPTFLHRTASRRYPAGAGSAIFRARRSARRDPQPEPGGLVMRKTTIGLAVGSALVLVAPLATAQETTGQASGT